MQAPIGEEPKIYFVGFAGVGDQRVFAEEIKLAARTVAMSMGTVTGEVSRVFGQGL